MAARIVVFAPIRVYSMAEHIARDVAALASRGPCRIEALVVPVPEPDAEPEVIVEGEAVCGLPAAEVLQGLLWLAETTITTPGFTLFTGISQQVALAEA